MTEALRFWALIELIGLGAAPLAAVLLARLPGAWLGLSGEGFIGAVRSI